MLTPTLKSSDTREDLVLAELDSVLSVETHIDQWHKHLEFLVKYLLDTEHRLCVEVFQKEAFKDGCMDCFAKNMNGTCEIFWKLSLQVELQRPTIPPVDGSVPRLVNFVVEYCNQLLEDEYWSILIQVVEIHQGWNNESFEKGLLLNEMQNIVTVLGINIETWTKRQEDASLSYLFLMNKYWYMCKYMRGKKLGELMGDEWITSHEEYMEYYETLYLKESWEKLPALLSEEDLVFIRGGRAIDGQSSSKETQRIHRVLPSYSNYLEKYIPSIEFEVVSTADQHIKYIAKTLGNMITSLFEPKVENCDSSTKCAELSGKISNNFVTNQLSSTPATI